jgi:hypothetical protein
MKDTVQAAVDTALQEFRRSRNLGAAVELIGKATRDGKLELGDYDEACDEFRRAIDTLANGNDEDVPVDWDELRQVGLLEQLGLTEVTETDIEPAKSGAVVTLAEQTAD